MIPSVLYVLPGFKSFTLRFFEIRFQATYTAGRSPCVVTPWSDRRHFLDRFRHDGVDGRMAVREPVRQSAAAVGAGQKRRSICRSRRRSARSSRPTSSASSCAPPPTLRRTVDAIRKAKADARVKTLVILPRGDGALWAQVQEVRGALEDFRRSGKPVTAYLEYGGAQEYYLASAADRIVMMPAGQLDVVGSGDLRAVLPRRARQDRRRTPTCCTSATTRRRPTPSPRRPSRRRIAR